MRREICDDVLPMQVEANNWRVQQSSNQFKFKGTFCDWSVYDKKLFPTNRRGTAADESSSSRPRGKKRTSEIVCRSCGREGHQQLAITLHGDYTS